MDEEQRISRRTVMKAIAGGAASMALASSVRPLDSLATPKPGEMPRRPLGRTGHQVRIFSLGGQATLEQSGTRDESLAIINRAIDLGVNYIDTARIYGRGQSETHIGEVMKTRRREVFLASKTRDRSYDGSMQSLEKTLATLQTDHLDLWQLHNIETDADLDQIFAKDGAIKALEQAREQKIVRFLGITGHSDPSVLKRGIERYPFDNVLVALNAADRHRASFIDNFLPTAVEKGMGIVGMKVPARGRLLRRGGVSSMKDAMRYVLTLPVSTVIIGISTLDELEENVRIAREFVPMKDAEARKIESLTRSYAEDATWFKA